jgi:hypothetical protein
MFKNVKIFVLYQNIGGHKGCLYSFTLKNRLGGVYGGVGEDFAVATLIFSLPLNIIYIIGACPLSFRWIICGALGGQS